MLAYCIFQVQTKKVHANVKKNSTGGCMRKIIPEQVQMGEIDITEINIELDNRDPAAAQRSSVYLF